MNRQQSEALRAAGQSGWNEWALDRLEARKKLEEGGQWAADWFGEATNDATREWQTLATADFADREWQPSETNFAGFIFPGPVRFSGGKFPAANFESAHFASLSDFRSARFDGDAGFRKAAFYGVADFEAAMFDGIADFDGAEFLKETPVPLVYALRMSGARFAQRADFRNMSAAGRVEFSAVAFAGPARFDAARCEAAANFADARFAANAAFPRARFAKGVSFAAVTFAGEAHFAEVEIDDAAGFSEALFGAGANFRASRIEQANFSTTSFEGDCRFADAVLKGIADFRGCRFQLACFARTQFEAAQFGEARFADDADFHAARFADEANFTAARFQGAGFSEAAHFTAARIAGHAAFQSANFAAKAAFAGMRAEQALVLSSTRFAAVPDFRDAELRGPTRLDTMTIADQPRLRSWPGTARDPRPLPMRRARVVTDGETAAKFRRLRLLARGAQDDEREREFFAAEMRSRRFWLDTPFGAGALRFWSGLVYGGLSNFGRSMRRPAVLWLISMPGFAAVYTVLRPGYAGWEIPCLARGESPLAEALSLSMHRAMLFGRWLGSGLDQAEGCLYGAGAGGAVPVQASLAAMAQASFSAAMLALVLLALMNALRLR